MKILSSEQCRLVDRYTIDHEPISSIDLMERASKRMVEWLRKEFGHLGSVIVFAGPGNNGGDALAVARILIQEDLVDRIDIVTCFFDKSPSPDCLTNLERLRSQQEIDIIPFDLNISLSDYDYIIDGLFGSGLARTITEPFASVVDHINESSTKVIAIDCPSGMQMDQSSKGPIVHSEITLTIGLPKLSLLLPESYQYSKRWEQIAIDLHPGGIEQIHTDNYFVDFDQVSQLYTRKDTFDHKGTNGKGLLICGSSSMTGAAVLAASAAMRSGIGLMYIHSVQAAVDVVRILLPEAITFVDENHHSISGVTQDLDQFDAIGIGCGVGLATVSVDVMGKLFTQCQKPMVIDADALNFLAQNPDYLKQLPTHSILTPHPKEFERLFGKSEDDFVRLDLLRKKATLLNVIIILKGAHSTVALPSGEVYFNSTGNPGMATAGSGDVLTGILTALLAQGYTPTDAAQLGVYIHGLAGDIAFDKLGSYEGVIASDIITNIPQAFATFY